MTAYAVRYAIVALLLFSLVYFEGFSPLFFLNELQTALTVQMTQSAVSLFSLPIRMEDNVLIFKHGMQLFVVNDCNGLAPLLLFWSAVAAFPTTLKTKIPWLLMGYVLLTMLNLIRIVAVAYGVTLDPQSFGWSHDIAGRYGMGVLTLLLYWIFTLRVEVIREHEIFLTARRFLRKEKV